MAEEQKQEIQTSGADEVKHTKDLWPRWAAFFSDHISGVATVSLPPCMINVPVALKVLIGV